MSSEHSVTLSYIQNGSVHREKCEVDFQEHHELCIIGAGTAGSMAAISGAMHGIDTVVIEKSNRIGGLGVNGGVFTYFYGSKNGLFTKINDECYEYEKNGYMGAVIDRRVEDAVSPVSKNYVLHKTAEKYGCNLYLSADVCGVYSIGRQIVGIRCIKDGNIINISAEVFVDCTSTAAAARMFGCEMLPGRKYDNAALPFSKAIGKITDDVCKDFDNGWWHYDYTHLPDRTEHFRISSLWSVFDMPCTDSAEKYSEKLLECSSIGPCISKNVSRMYYLGSVPGEREIYHVQTEKVITIDDIVHKDENTTPLFYTFEPLDCTNADIGFEDFTFQDWKMCVSDMGFSIGIEKETLIAKAADNLLIAGKILGADHSAAGGIRMRADMEKCGEAAAAIALCSIKSGTPLRETDSAEIQKILSETNCYCKDDNKNFAELRVPVNTERKPYAFPDDGEIKKAFESTYAGRALWKTIYLWDSQKRDILKEWLNTGTDTFRLNCAYALGASGDESGRKLITDFINKAEPVSGDELSYCVYPRYIRSLSIAARYGWTEVIDTLEETLSCEALNIYPPEFSKFRYAVTSLCIRTFETIYNQCPELQNRIRLFLLNLATPKDNFMKRIYANTPFLKT